MHIEAVAKREGGATRERGRALSAVVEQAGPSRAEWIGWRGVARIISRGRKWIYRRAREGLWDARLDTSSETERWIFRRAAVEAWAERIGRPA